MNNTRRYYIGGAILAIALTVVVLSYGDQFNAVAQISQTIPQSEKATENKIRDYTEGSVGTNQLYFIHISSGSPDVVSERNSAWRGIQNANLLQDAGKDVVIFLDVNGVQIADEDHPPVLISQHEALKQFLNNGGRVIICDLCEGTFEVENLLRGVEVDLLPSLPRFQKLLSHADVVLDY